MRHMTDGSAGQALLRLAFAKVLPQNKPALQTGSFLPLDLAFLVIVEAITGDRRLGSWVHYHFCLSGNKWLYCVAHGSCPVLSRQRVTSTRAKNFIRQSYSHTLFVFPDLRSNKYKALSRVCLSVCLSAC